ncbi:hypothetical protein PPTG_22327 [Phytophthora nicotianae INRA-310]|uniref:Uncharacterized protein n=1 Tax=Phytophthora nicotianae (strain INRA-310) TaxID=761204 RepID=W2QK90_PHYN3|nr:hypothetical protein PPTG_22327 [Phytophthora nicotianae INRA-310]ETN13301.1 hypothetical protein PPTG_22327 [Phytophthora nicotianae INRA-310]
MAAPDDARRYVQLIEDVKHSQRESPAHAPEVEPRILSSSMSSSDWFR